MSGVDNYNIYMVKMLDFCIIIYTLTASITVKDVVVIVYLIF